MAKKTIPQDRQIVTYSQAKALGLTTYFTGKPCKYGHVAERSSSGGGCAECSRLQRAKWRAENPELSLARSKLWARKYPDKAKAANKAWRAANPNKVKAHKRGQYQRHRDRYLANMAVYHEKNADKILKRVMDWQTANPDKVKANKRKWVERHPDQVRLNGSIQAARRRNAEGRFTQEDIDAIFKGQNGKCAYCRTSIEDGFDIDHIVALKNGGTNWPSNLQLCCDSCNSRKSDKDPIDFARSLGMLL